VALEDKDVARGRAKVAVIMAGLVVLVAGCGAGPAHGVASIGSTTSTTSAAAPAGRPAPAVLGAKLQKYSSCMRSHGVANFPDPIISGNGVSLQITPGIAGSPQFAAAQAACRSLLPGRPQGANFTTQQQTDYLKAAECMRSHGLTGFPDPTFSGGQVGFNLPSGMDANSTPFRRARVICEKLIPQGLPYSN
jgi:hypothetical protein